ncbi:hypothetical protein [Lentzea sp. NPDC059081]|uniref:hypothetical protein n=1 Tax=Lentzea sp. NPDC059081 TaxID=3346719 RepID=UPI003677CB3B
MAKKSKIAASHLGWSADSKAVRQLKTVDARTSRTSPLAQHVLTSSRFDERERTASHRGELPGVSKASW